MHTVTSRLARVSAIAAVLGVLLVPIAASAQRAGRSDAGMPGAVSAFLNLDSVQPHGPAVITAKTGAALNTAIESLNEMRYADARTAIGALRLDRLSPYERGKTEQILFHIANGERKYAEARQHLQSAIESGGLTQQEVTETLREIERIDARLAAAPVA